MNKEIKKRSKPIDLIAINGESKEGKMLQAAIAIISSESRTSDTPMEVLGYCWELAKEMNKGMTFEEYFTGVELIAKERQEQIKKHRRTIESDVIQNSDYKQLVVGACALLKTPLEDAKPINWNQKIWNHMCNKPYKKRLIIAGALIAAEIDRVQKLENKVKL